MYANLNGNINATLANHIRVQTRVIVTAKSSILDQSDRKYKGQCYGHKRPKTPYMSTSLIVFHILPFVVRVGQGHVEVGVDGVEGVSYEKDGFFPLERSVAHPLRVVSLHHPHAVVHDALSL